MKRKIVVLFAGKEGPAAFRPVLGRPLGAFALDRNSFDPSAGESVTIGLGSGSAAKVEIYNMAGTLVRTIESDGETTAVWDGRNDDGDALSSGAYFVRIRTDDGDAVRKVALVK